MDLFIYWLIYISIYIHWLLYIYIYIYIYIYMNYKNIITSSPLINHLFRENRDRETTRNIYTFLTQSQLLNCFFLICEILLLIFKLFIAISLLTILHFSHKWCKIGLEDEWFICVVLTVYLWLATLTERGRIISEKHISFSTGSNATTRDSKGGSSIG